MDITLREWREADLDDLVRYANNIRVANNLRDSFPHPYDRYDGVAYIQSAIRQDPKKNFAIDLKGQAVGSVGIELQSDVYRRNAELGYWLAEPFWGQGIMVSVIDQMREYVFGTFDIDRIYAIPFGSNVRSQKILEKSGFKLEARLEKTIFKNGKFEDELIYSIRRQDISY